MSSPLRHLSSLSLWFEAFLQPRKPAVLVLGCLMSAVQLSKAHNGQLLQAPNVSRGVSSFASLRPLIRPPHREWSARFRSTDGSPPPPPPPPPPRPSPLYGETNGTINGRCRLSVLR